MSVHQAWLLVCRLFENGKPIREGLLADADRALLPSLEKMVKRHVVSGGPVLCPYCAQHGVQVLLLGDGRRFGRCSDCGTVPVEAQDLAFWALDEDWLRRSLRRALEVQSFDGVDELANGVWRLGDARQSPVILARSISLIWKAPELLGRVAVPGRLTRLITPVARGVHGTPFGPSVQWLPLQERFILYGDGVSAIGLSDEPSSILSSEPAALSDSTAPVYGPFSDDFRWVTVPQIQADAIRLTKTQAAVFRALWDLKGQSVPGARVMQAAGSASAKPGDLFKGQNYALARQAFKVLVVIDDREGLYMLPCAKQERN